MTVLLELYRFWRVVDGQLEGRICPVCGHEFLYGQDVVSMLDRWTGRTYVVHEWCDQTLYELLTKEGRHEQHLRSAS